MIPEIGAIVGTRKSKKTIMLLNYFKLAIRLLIRNPFFSLINVLGLALGFSAFMVLWHHTSNELRSDRHHPAFEHKTRLVFDWKTRDDSGNITEAHIAGFAPEFAAVLAAEHPELQQYTRLYHHNSFDVGLIGDHGKKVFLTAITDGSEVTFMEENLAYVDPNFFDFFSVPLINGNSQSVLSQGNGIILSESMAQKYFGHTDVTGKMLTLNDSIALEVSGVFKKLPHNTHLNFDAVMSTTRIAHVFDKVRLNGVGCATYFKVMPEADRNALDLKITTTARNYISH